MYDDFASVYDTLMDDFDYDEWSRHYLRLIRLATGELPRRAAECACGTGSLTVRLAQSGMAMTGVDLSAAMLRQAEKKARDYGVEAAFVRQDMKKLTLPRRVGAVLATCDGVNYLTTPEDVRAFFGAAYRNLLPGGALCFDCSTRHKLEDVMGDAFFGEERDGAAVYLGEDCTARQEVRYAAAGLGPWPVSEQLLAALVAAGRWEPSQIHVVSVTSRA